VIAITVDDVLAVLMLGVEDSYDDSSSLLDHQLACASLLIEWRPWDVELAIAGLVHDVGQVLTGNRDERHASVGARFVGDVLGTRVTALVRLHDAAERYFAQRVSRDLAGPLSPPASTSMHDFETQLHRFESSPYYADALLLQRAHARTRAAAKVERSLSEWMPAMFDHAARCRELPPPGIGRPLFSTTG
jgi:predicted HD phosphohydrolase